jgi:hypothetical protein
MAKHNPKTTRPTVSATQRRIALEPGGSRLCAGYEVTVKIEPPQTSHTGRSGKIPGIR